MAKEFWEDDAPAETSVPAESGGDFWLSDKPAAQQDLPAGVTPSTAGAGRGNAGLADYRAKEAAQTAEPARAAWEDHADQLMTDTAAPAAKKVSVLEGVQLHPEKPWSFREASETRRAIDDMPVRRGESIATPVPTAAGIGMDIRDSIKNPAARGVVAGFTGLGQVLPGAVEAAADFVGADGVADVAARTARTGRQIAAPLQPKAGNDKLVFDITNSITQTAPTLIMGLGGGPAMTALFGQSAAQEYSQGRAAGLDGGTAAARAGVMAGAEVLGERFGFGEQIKILKGLTARIPAEELAPIFARQIMKEIPGEQLTTLVQFLGDKYGPGAQNPEAALSDYLQQAGDTLKVTIGQTAVMGGGPVAISEARKQFARPVDRTPQIEALRKTGDETAAALLEQRQQKEQAAFTTDREAQALADFGPDLQQRYRDTRMAGAKTGDAVVQTAARWNFDQAAQLAGLSPKAQEAISNKLAEVPAEKAAGFVQKAITGLVNAGQAQPFDGLDTLAQTIETQRDQMLDSVLATMADIETLEQQDAPQEAATAAVYPAAAEAPGLGDAGVDGVDQPGAVPALSDINDVMVTPELDAVHAAATSPLNDLPEPTDAQKKAGNYKLGKIRISGLDISIENPQGSERRGVDPDGNEWTTPMRDHYGYFKGTTAADGDKMDVFIKPGTPQDYAGPVFVVDQVDPKTGKFDEHKVVFGAADQAEAEAIYRRNYSADWQGLANITALPMPAFKAWASSKETRKPLGAITEQANVQNAAPGTEAQAAAAPVEAPAPAGINAAAAAGLPAATGAGDVQADGVNLLGQNSQPLSEGGKPFKTELAARKEKKLHPDKRVVKSPDGKGYILKPMSAKQIAAQEAAARRIRGADTGDKGPLSAHGFILARGGLAKSSMADAGFDKNVRIGNRWLFTDSGKTLAQAGQDLKEAGFITDETENAASDIIRRSISSPQYTAEGWEAVAEAEAQTRFEDHLKAQQESEEDPFASLSDDGYTAEDTEGTGFDQASPEIQAEVAALSAQLEAMGEDSETILERVALQYPDATQQEYHEHVKAAITAAVAEAAQPEGRGDPGQDDGEQSQAREGTGESLTDRPDGTLSVRGDTKALRERLTAAGIPAKSILPSATGVVVGRTQAEKAREVLTQTLTAPTKSDIEAQQERVSRADELDARAQVKRESEAGADSFTLTVEDGRQDTTQPMFSRGADPLAILSETDDLYSMPKSDKDTIEGITADHDSEIKVRKTDLPGNETMYTLTMPDGTPARITVRKSGPGSVYGAETDADNNTTWETGRPGENPEDVPDDMEDVWIDVSNLKPGQNGARVYNIAATFAHNTGRMFIGDPSGLSDEAMRRRAEHMLSSALKFGTTRHLAPHPRQTDGATGLGIPALKWVYGDDVGNIQRLAELNVKALDSVFPEASAITYDPATGTFSTELAERLNPSDVRDLFSRGTLADRQGSGRRAARAGAGWRTLARGAVFRSLLRGRGTGGDGAGRAGAGESLLDQLVRQRAQLASATKDGRIFYSRPLTAELFRQMTTPMQRGMKTADLQKAIAQVLKRWENGPNVTVVATTKDLPMPAPGDVHGVYFGGNVYLVAQNIRDKAKAMEVLTHEAIAHHGLREMLGKDDWKKFMGNIQLALKTGNKPLAAIRKDVRAAYVDDTGKFNLSEMQEADEIAAKVVEQAVDAEGNFRPGFGFVKSVYAKVVEFLRSVGIDVKMTHAELQGALVNAQRFLEAGNRAAGAKKTAKPVFARAYHGTPHRFERFTTDAIGTGEGAQAYGWGLYFASKKEIAEHYRKGLSYKQIVKEFRDEMPDDADFDEALDAADTMSPQRARVIRALAADDWLGFDYPSQAITAAFKELDAYDASQELQDAVNGAQGQLYEVEIPEDSEILLWDKPLSEQPKKVLDALKQLAVDGADYYPTLAGMMQPMESGNTTGRAVYMAMQRESGSDKNASRELRSAGIRGIKYLDGVSRDKGDGSFNYVVFSGDDVSIVEAAYSRTAKAPASIEAEKAAGAAKPAQAEMFQPGFWDAPQETRLDKVIFELQDGRIDLRRVQEAITKANTIPEKFDARLQETLYPGRVATRAKKFLDDEAKPLLDAMARNNVTMVELADYLHARHAEERNKQIAKVNPDLPDGGAGKNSKGVLMTTEAAKQHIAGLSEGKRMVLTAMAKRVDAITQGTTKLLVDEGLEKQETIDAWTGAYKSYVPLFRDEAENGNPHPTGSGMSVRGGSSKRAVGSTKQATNILAHVLMQREAAITRAEKNRVAVALYGLALTNPNPDFWTTIKPGMSPEAIGRELQRMGVDPTVAEAGMMGVPTIKTVDPTLGRVVSRPNPMYKSLPGAIVLKVNGEDRVLMVNVNDPRGLRMAENLKNMDGLTKFDIAGSIVGKTTRWLASVNTQYNPAFGLVNLTRDTLGGAINLSSTKLRGKTLKVLAMTPGALKGIGLELSGKKSGEWGRLFRQFQQDGGQTGYREMFKDANDRAKALEAELKAMEKAGKLSTDKVAGKVLGALDIFNTTLENAVRLAAYREALQEGMSRPEAARLGRELTVDFNRKGRMGRELGPLYAFFNASVQGSARTLQTLAGPDGAKIIAGGVSLGVLQAVMLLAAGYDDDEIPEFVKARALIIPLGTDDEGKKRYFTIPLPLGLHVLPNTGRVLAELTMDGGKDALSKGFDAVGEIAGAFNPLGGGNIFTADGALRTVAPTVIDPVIEVLSNKNFAGTAIEREGYGNDPRPGFERAREGTLRAPTGQAYLEISRILNKVSGGDEYEAGRVSPTPEMVRYMAQVVGGGLLREIEKTVNTSIAMSKGEDAKPTGLPVFGRFYGEVDDASVQRSRYYDNLTAIEKAEKLVRAAEKKGDLDAADRIEADKPEAMLKKEKNRAVNDLRELNKEAMETVGDSESIRALDEERTAVMRDLNEAAAEIDAPRRDATLGARLRKSMAAAP
ncbi:MAG TPA: LPD38 domain-containing protein [Ramlibacter sp.]|nr:LPD38 domain-containing protein [Ramlibacter sp.]